MKLSLFFGNTLYMCSTTFCVPINKQVYDHSISAHTRHMKQIKYADYIKYEIKNVTGRYVNSRTLGEHAD